MGDRSSYWRVTNLNIVDTADYTYDGDTVDNTDVGHSVDNIDI